MLSGNFLLGNRVKKSCPWRQGYPYFATFACKLELSVSLGPEISLALGKLGLLVDRALVFNTSPNSTNAHDHSELRLLENSVVNLQFAAVPVKLFINIIPQPLLGFKKVNSSSMPPKWYEDIGLVIKMFFVSSLSVCKISCCVIYRLPSQVTPVKQA